MKNNKNNLLQIRLDDTEKEYVKLVAKSYGYENNISEYARTSMIRPLNIEKQSKRDRRLDICYQVNKAGVNLNQIAHNLNTYNKLSNDILKSVNESKEILADIVRRYS